MSSTDDYTKPTAKWPVMNPDMQAMLKAYLDDPGAPSVYKLWLVLPLLIPPLQQQGSFHKFETRRTVNALSSVNMRGTLELLWAIEPKMLLSILRQTVAVDFHNVSPRIHCNVLAPGIYVVTIEIKGRRGKFLSSKEIEEVQQRLEQYKVAARFVNEIVVKAKRFSNSTTVAASDMEKHRLIGRFIDAWNLVSGKTAIPPSKKATTEVVNALDDVAVLMNAIDGINVKRPWQTDGSRFIPTKATQGANGEEVMDRLSAMLERRKLAVKGHPDYNVHASQSPLYIGCSNSLSKRTACYSSTHSRAKINKHLQIMLGVLDSLGMDADLKVRAVLRTWRDEQLPIAEALLTALGHSLVWQDGFNSEEGGGQKGDTIGGTLIIADNFVKTSGWFPRNANLTAEEIAAIGEKSEKTFGVLGDAEGDLRSLKHSRDALEDAALLYPDMAKRAIKLAEGAEERLSKITRATTLLGDLCNVFQLTSAALGCDSNEDEQSPGELPGADVADDQSSDGGLVHDSVEESSAGEVIEDSFDDSD